MQSADKSSQESGDIYLDRLSNECVRVQPRSVFGMLWLQTHFEDEHWEQLSQGAVGINNRSAIFMSQDASMSGLHVIFPAT